MAIRPPRSSSSASRHLEPFDHLGAASPRATLATYSPGARALLAGAEHAAERGLHLARGVLLLLLSLGWFAGYGFSVPPVFLGGLLAAAGIWLLVWRVLSRPSPPWWLRYLLVVADAFLVTRAVLLVNGPLADLYSAIVQGRLSPVQPQDVAVMVPPLLAYVAFSGALRIDMRLALFSTLVALVAFGLAAASLALPSQQVVLAGISIAFAGGVSVHAARIFRYEVLKAQEQQVLERYVPESLTLELARHGAPERSAREEEITLLIADIRGFTTRAERLTPPEALAFLNRYFSVVLAPLGDERAILDKYLGDGVLAFFEGEAHTERALRALHGMLAALEHFNASLDGTEPVRIGIALHTGRAMLGTIGTPLRREYTVISDAVNVTARLEELNKGYNAVAVVSAATLRDHPDPAADGFVGPLVTPLRGREGNLQVYVLPDPDAASDAPAV